MTRKERAAIQAALYCLSTGDKHEQGIVILQKLVYGTSSLEDCMKGLKPTTIAEAWRLAGERQAEPPATENDPAAEEMDADQEGVER